MANRSKTELARVFEPILNAAQKQASVADGVVDRDLYRIYLATLWANLAMDPAAAGIDETDLEGAHNAINGLARRVLGEEEAIAGAFRFIDGKEGERALDRAKATSRHRALLRYFCSMILDPAGHRQRMAAARAARKSTPT